MDNTDLRHNPVLRIRARGDHQGVSIDPTSYPQPGLAGFNGTADVYTFRYDGFEAGDFIKIQFGGMPGSTNNGGSGGSSFAGLMFDVVPNPRQSTLPPSPQLQPSPQTAPATSAGTTTAPISQASSPAGGGSSGGGCALGGARADRLARLSLLLLLLAPLALRGRWAR
ncbi:MAG: hypothetical protein JKY65_29400 [Planctomycetes bacterium]|nr:hypothetical protein [Planctomycetota bacterium]